jgi:hypothetical protein
VRHLVHALADPNRGGEVVHRVDALHRLVDLRAIVDVAHDQLDFLREVLGPPAVLAVHLGVQ